MSNRRKASAKAEKSKHGSSSGGSGKQVETEMKKKGQFLQQLFHVYEDLSFSSTPHSSSSKADKSKAVDPDDVETKRALDAAADAEKAAKQARAKANEMIKKANGRKRPLPQATKAGASGAKQQEGAKPQKRKRYTWSEDLHRRFLATIFDIGLRQAKPKLLLDMLQLPEGLTTEHIKSHLQKYRKNSKKTRELFMAQFDIAKEQATQNHDGKALNPGFHAYPMPVGRFPLRLPDRKDPKQTRYQLTPTTYSVKPATPRLDKVLYDGEGNKVVVTGKGDVYYLEQPDPKKKKRREKPPPPPVVMESAERLPPQTLELFKQMEAQVEIHNQIQERHRMQQLQHYPGNSAGASSSAGNTAAASSSSQQAEDDPIDPEFVFSPPMLSANHDANNQDFQMNLDQNLRSDDEDLLFGFLE